MKELKYHESLLIFGSIGALLSLLVIIPILGYNEKTLFAPLFVILCIILIYVFVEVKLEVDRKSVV